MLAARRIGSFGLPAKDGIPALVVALTRAREDYLVAERTWLTLEPRTRSQSERLRAATDTMIAAEREEATLMVALAGLGYWTPGDVPWLTSLLEGSPQMRIAALEGLRQVGNAAPRAVERIRTLLPTGLLDANVVEVARTLKAIADDEVTFALGISILQRSIGDRDRSEIVHILANLDVPLESRLAFLLKVFFDTSRASERRMSDPIHHVPLARIAALAEIAKIGPEAHAAADGVFALEFGMPAGTGAYRDLCMPLTSLARVSANHPGLRERCFSVLRERAPPVGHASRPPGRTIYVRDTQPHRLDALLAVCTIRPVLSREEYDLVNGELHCGDPSRRLAAAAAHLGCVGADVRLQDLLVAAIGGWCRSDTVLALVCVRALGDRGEFASAAVEALAESPRAEATLARLAREVYDELASEH
jgi:hypothetical protein